MHFLTLGIGLLLPTGMKPLRLSNAFNKCGPRVQKIK